jgi:hypothetical protein
MPDEVLDRKPEPLKLLSAKDVRKDTEIEVDLGDGTFVKARKLDMTLLIFEGQIPMALLAAAQRMMDMPDGTIEDRVRLLGEGESRSMIEMMRQHAATVVIQPRITMDDTSDPNALPASYLTLPQLLAIWNATAIIPRFAARPAARFRSDAGTDAPAPAPTGESVPPAAVELVTADGKRVDYLGQ